MERSSPIHHQGACSVVAYANFWSPSTWTQKITWPSVTSHWQT
jgi:hypothetical protein